MQSSSKVVKREGPYGNSLRKMLANLRSEMTWLDLLVGLGAVSLLSMMLVGFRFQITPTYPVGSVAPRDVRASVAFTYEDIDATSQRRDIARAGTPALYDLDTRQIAARENEISRAFSEARDFLAQKTMLSRGVSGPASRETLLKELDRNLGGVFPTDVLRIFLSQKFNTALEGELLRILDTVFRDGIIRDADRAQFLKHQRVGILVRDDLLPRSVPLSEAYAVRNLSAAREHLREFQLELAALQSPDRTLVIQYLATRLFPTLSYNERDTNARKQAAALQVPPVEVHLAQGKLIVRAGEEVTRNIAAQLDALRNLQKPRSLAWQFLGFFFFASTLVYALWRYFVHYHGRDVRIRSHMLLILVVLTAVILIMRLLTELAEILSERISIDALSNPNLLDYAVPFALGSLLVTLLVSTDLGIFTAIAVAALSGLFYSDVYIMSYVLVVSLVGIYGVRQYKDRAALQKAGLTIAFVGSICIFSIDVLRQVPGGSSGVWSRVAFATVSGLLTSAFASMLLPALESLFKITTDIRLLELSNLNAPILRRLSVEAPGTYHHSLMVGTLGEAAAEAIGANPLLVRVGAYYHDLGKMVKPEYFVENQVFGINKHENLSPHMSCLIIASHVKDGLEMAKEIGLAEKIRDLIPQHHGTRIMSYFFQKAKESQDLKDHEIEDASFRYPGPKPQSKEAAIMMMADSVEAASRTLTNPTPAQIQGMIDRLVDTIVADRQFEECDITMRDVSLVKESFLKVLTGFYHRRIDYPGYDFKQIGSDSGKGSIQNSGVKPAASVQDSQAPSDVALLKDSSRP